MCSVKSNIKKKKKKKEKKKLSLSPIIKRVNVNVLKKSWLLSKHE